MAERGSKFDADIDDFGADEPVKPPRGSRPRSSATIDIALTMTGIALACSAAMFPWYVFFNPEKFTVAVAPMDRTRDLPPGEARNVFSVSPLALVARDPQPQKVPETLDPMTTATVSNIGRDPDPAGPEPTKEALAGDGGFRLVHVANGRALIEDASGLFMVKVGSILPDNSRVATLEQRDGRWVIITSTGAIYPDQ